MPAVLGQRRGISQPHAGRAFPWDAGQAIWGMLVKHVSGGKWWVWETRSQPVLQGLSQGKSWRRRAQRWEVLSWEMRAGTPGKKNQGILRE